jgi:hypothetical protein
MILGHQLTIGRHMHETKGRSHVQLRLAIREFYVPVVICIEAALLIIEVCDLILR